MHEMKNTDKEVENLHITGYDALPSPGQIKEGINLKVKLLKQLKKANGKLKIFLKEKIVG